MLLSFFKEGKGYFKTIAWIPINVWFKKYDRKFEDLWFILLYIAKSNIIEINGFSDDILFQEVDFCK